MGNSKKVNKNFLFLLLIFFLLAFAGLRICLFDDAKNSYWWDEVVYLHLADNLRSGEGYSSEIGESFRPPLLPTILSFTAGENAAHVMILLMVILTGIISYFFVKELHSEGEGIISVLLLLTLPLYFFWSSKILSESLSLLLVISSLWLFYKWDRSSNCRYLYCAVALAGLAFMARTLVITLALSFVIYILFKEKFSFIKIIKTKSYWISTLIFLLVLIPYFYIGVRYFSNPFGAALYQINLTANKKDFLFYLVNLFKNLGFILVLFLTGLFCFRKNEFKKYRVFICYLLTHLFVIAIVLAHNAQNRFLIPVLLPIIAVAAFGCTQVIRSLWRNKTLIGVIVVILIIFISINIFTGYNQVKNDPAKTKILIEGAEYLKEFPDGAMLCSSIPYCYFFSKKDIVIVDFRKSLSFPETKNEFLNIIKDKNVKYLFIDNFHHNEPAYTNFISERFKLIWHKQTKHRYVSIYKIE